MNTATVEQREKKRDRGSFLASMRRERRQRSPLSPGLAALLLAMAGCSGYDPGKLDIDRSIQAKSQSSRVDFIVLHYTSADNETSLRILSEGNVSSHYLITDHPRPRVYQLVDESRRAWHAGASSWYGRSGVNSSSIGVEVVNPGKADETWSAYSSRQIATLATLLRDLISRHQIKPQNIVGHSDIAPQRKIDPGPLFPWKKLADEGIGRWYDEAAAQRYERDFQANGLPDAAWVQQELGRVGYEVPRSGLLDPATRNVIAAFQMRYRPELFDGMPDARTLAILKALP